MFTLFRVATLEQWFLFLADGCRTLSPNFVCKNIENYNDYAEYGLYGCGTLWAYPFFIVFYFIIILLLNLLVGIIINITIKIKRSEESSVNVYQLDDIKRLWADFDPDGTGYMTYKDFWVFTSRIAIILGIKISELLNIEAKKKFLKLLNLRIYEDLNNNNIYCFRFHEVVLELSKISVIIKFNVSRFLLW